MNIILTGVNIKILITQIIRIINIRFNKKQIKNIIGIYSYTFVYTNI